MAKQNEFERQKNSEILKDNALLKYQLELIKSKRESFEFADKSQQLLYEKNNEDLLLGIEKIVGNKNTIVSEFENENLQKMFQFSKTTTIEQVTIHEFVHTFQKDGEINVLSKAIKEGSETIWNYAENLINESVDKGILLKKNDQNIK